MNSATKMTWETFRQGLSSHPGLGLQFNYDGNKRVKSSYHITEIKQAVINSVDCGGKVNKWEEVIIQLWEPAADEQQVMKVEKAISIIDIVERKLALDLESTVKIEYGNADSDTRQLLPASVTADDANVVVQLVPDTTQCKAGETCGAPEPGELKSSSCCAPALSCC